MGNYVVEGAAVGRIVRKFVLYAVRCSLEPTVGFWSKVGDLVSESPRLAQHHIDRLQARSDRSHSIEGRLLNKAGRHEGNKIVMCAGTPQEAAGSNVARCLLTTDSAAGIGTTMLAFVAPTTFVGIVRVDPAPT